VPAEYRRESNRVTLLFPLVAALACGPFHDLESPAYAGTASPLAKAMNFAITCLDPEGAQPWGPKPPRSQGRIAEPAGLVQRANRCPTSGAPVRFSGWPLPTPVGFTCDRRSLSPRSRMVGSNGPPHGHPPANQRAAPSPTNENGSQMPG
jgi:hypothetical protein